MKFSANHRVVFEETPLAEKNIYSTNFLIKRKRKTQLQINRNFVFFFKKKGSTERTSAETVNMLAPFHPRRLFFSLPRTRNKTR